MWSRTYRDHFIMAFPSFDAETRKWRAQADISWYAGTRRDSVFLRYRRHAATEVQAVTLALQQSVEWIDRRIVSGDAYKEQTSLESAFLVSNFPRKLVF